MSRSEIPARAAQRYLKKLDGASVAQQIDSALAWLDEPDESSASAVAIGHRVLAGSDEQW